jgi:7-carboxy-7-deazaguanine synthase
MNSNQSINELLTFPIVEQFYSIQGEGYHTGKPAYFVRFGGCNVCCGWCDVKESWNPAIHPMETLDSIIGNITMHKAKSIVVTGGEPLMHNLEEFCNRLHNLGIETFLETSGTHPMTGKWTWVCLSPKKHHQPIPINYTFAQELKVIIDKNLDFAWAEECAQKVSDSCILYLQPEWNSYESAIPGMVDYIKKHPKWRISIQTHKFMHIQ